MSKSEKQTITSNDVGTVDVATLTDMPRLYQIHHQDKKDTSKTKFLAQEEIKSSVQMRAWHQFIMEKFPLPEGKQWMICNESSKYFIKQKDKPKKE